MSGFSVRFRVDSWNPQGAVFDPLAAAVGMAIAGVTSEAKANLVRRETPSPSRIQTGKLLKSIAGLRVGRYTGRIVARTKYAASQELGSRPHIIAARKAANLAFPWDKAPDGYFVGPVVFHPGTEGLHFIGDAAKNFRDWLQLFGRRVFR